MGRQEKWSWVAFTASVVAIGAAFLPWAKVVFFSASGFDAGDGKVTAAAGALAAAMAALAATEKAHRAVHAVTVVCAFVIGAIGVIDAADIASLDADQAALGLEATVGEGLYLTILAAGAMLVAAIGALASPATRRAAAFAAAVPPAAYPPGWYPDPYGAARLRWWDGTQWTPHAQS